MKRKAEIFRWFVIILLAASAGFYYGCGSVSNESNGGDGSVSTTVGGSTSVGTDVTLNVTSNRSSMKVGDLALINVEVSCTAQVGNNTCVTDGTNFFFSANPINSNDTSQADFSIVANYTNSGEGTLSQVTNTLTLGAGTRADATASPPVAVVVGASTSAAFFTVTVTAVSPGSSVFTAQSFDAVASLVIDVFANTTSPITGN
jgi:hypothetical protein